VLRITAPLTRRITSIPFASMSVTPRNTLGWDYRQPTIVFATFVSSPALPVSTSRRRQPLQAARRAPRVHQHPRRANHNQLVRSQSWLSPIIRYPLARRIPQATSPLFTGPSADLADTVEEPRPPPFL
jgi:hypothetical protein